MKQEFTGKDIDSAITAACSALKIPRKDLHYEVLSTGASGIFGIVGRRDAKIRIKQSSLDSSGVEMDGVKSIVDEAFGKEKSPKRKTPRSRNTKKQPDSQKKRGDKAARKQEVQNTQEVKNDTSQDPVVKKNDENQKVLPGRTPAAEIPEKLIELGREAVQKMADLITDESCVTSDAKKDVLTLKIEGGSSGILIGRKGQTLDAMQFLADKIINRRSEDRIRVRVDIEGYMETRKANLKHLAQKMAAKAKKTGRPATINQMNSQDRRIVHMTLKNDNQVHTQSMGEGYYRRLVIFPKKKYKGNKTSGK